MEELQENQKTPSKKVKILLAVVSVIACLALLLSLTVVVWWSIIGVESFDDGWKAVQELFGVENTDPTNPTNPSQLPDDNKVFENRNEIVAVMEDRELTNGQLQVYYWTSVYDFLKENSYYLYYLGIDLSKPLSQQACYVDDCDTWQDYFLQDALDDWHKYQAMAIEAEEAGLELPEDLQKTLDELEASMTKVATDGKYASLEAMIQHDYGPGCTFEDYKAYMQIYFQGYHYFNEQLKKVDTSEQALSDYFDANAEKLTEQGFKKDNSKYYDVRHILVAVVGTEGSDGKVMVTDADWTICKQKAQAILDEWLAGERTEETFAEFANKYSDDKEGNVTDGGLYPDLDEKTNFVTPFKDWYLDENRQKGDYGLVKTTYGYHIMYQSNMDIKWQVECKYLIQQEASNSIMKEVDEQHAVMSIEKQKIMIGNVKFS